MHLDHGELQKYGGLHQKWYNAFEETVRVPMVSSEAGASSLRRGVVTDELSSHEDLVPTLLSLAEINGDLSAESGPVLKTYQSCQAGTFVHRIKFGTLLYYAGRYPCGADA